MTPAGLWLLLAVAVPIAFLSWAHVALGPSRAGWRAAAALSVFVLGFVLGSAAVAQ